MSAWGLEAELSRWSEAGVVVDWQRDGGAVTAWLSCKHMGAASGKVINVSMYRELVWGAGIGSRGGNVMELHGWFTCW